MSHALNTTAVGGNHVPKPIAPQFKRAWDDTPKSLSREGALRVLQKLRIVGGYKYNRHARTVEFSTFLEPAVIALGGVPSNNLAN